VREAERRALAPTLLRLSQLARFWELNPQTIMGWIRQGRLAAIRSPGNHFRVRVADVRAFCEREGRPVPPFVAPPPRRVVTASPLPRGLKLPAVVVEAHAEPYGALVAAAAGGATVLVLPASAGRFDAEAALTALRKAPATASLRVLVVGATTHPRAEALQRAGAARVLLRSQGAELPRVLRELLGLE
jgi:excisionase family DNA binding protein